MISFSGKAYQFIFIAIIFIIFSSCEKQFDDSVIQEKQTISGKLTTTEDFSLIQAAVIRSGLKNLLDSTGTFTFFAPTNSAFQIAGYPDAASIEKCDYKKIIALLSYHITKERLFSSDWSNGMQALMINNKLITMYQNGNEFMVKGENSELPTRIIKQNTMAKNGIVHSIERLIE